MPFKLSLKLIFICLYIYLDISEDEENETYENDLVLADHEIDFINEKVTSTVENYEKTKHSDPIYDDCPYNPTIFCQFENLKNLILSLPCPKCFSKSLQVLPLPSNGIIHNYRIQCGRKSRHKSNPLNIFANINTNRGSSSSCSYFYDFYNFDKSFDFNNIFLQSIQSAGIRKNSFERFLLQFGLGGFDSSEEIKPAKLLITGGESK